MPWSFHSTQGSPGDLASTEGGCPEQPFIRQTGASEYGLRAVLSQEDKNGEDYRCIHQTITLSPEMNYSVIQKEYLAIVWYSIVRAYINMYLKGRHFIVQSNHQPRAWLEKMKNANWCLTRWALAVQPYRLTMQHRSACNNGNADGLLREPLLLSDILTSQYPCLTF